MWYQALRGSPVPRARWVRSVPQVPTVWQAQRVKLGLKGQGVKGATKEEPVP